MFENYYFLLEKLFKYVFAEYLHSQNKIFHIKFICSNKVLKRNY